MASQSELELSRLTGARQTMPSWAKVVETFDALPEVYRDSYRSVLGEGRSFPYTVFAPSIAGIRRKPTEKLLCETNDSIHIWERLGSQIFETEYPLSTISDVEIGRILLYSWITISGMTKAGKISSTTIEFNSATTRHFARFINRIRPVPVHGSELAYGIEKEKFDHLATENFKFMNYAIDSLVEGEKVLQIILLPKIYKPVISFGRHVLYQIVLAAAQLLILTDKEIILIQDDERSDEKRGVRYGGKWRYIPLRNIDCVSLVEHNNELMTFSLRLSPGEMHVDISFPAVRRRELAQFQVELEKLIL